MSLQGHIDYALKDSLDFDEFTSRLERVGVEVIPFRRTGERITGVSFRINGQLMKGSNLGRAYSWNGLQKRGLSYEKERDLSLLQTIKNQEKGLTDKSVENKIYENSYVPVNSLSQLPKANIEFDKDAASKVAELNRIAGVNLTESAKEIAETHENLTFHKEHQSLTTIRESSKTEMQKDTREKTANRGFDRIR